MTSLSAIAPEGEVTKESNIIFQPNSSSSNITLQVTNRSASSLSHTRTSSNSSSKSSKPIISFRCNNNNKEPESIQILGVKTAMESATRNNYIHNNRVELFVTKQPSVRTPHLTSNPQDLDTDEGVSLDDYSISSKEEETDAPQRRHDQQQSPNKKSSDDEILTRGQKLSRKWSTFIIRTFHKPLIHGVQSLTGLSARNPIRTIIFLIILSLTLFAIGMTTNFVLESDEDKQWTPSTSDATKYNDWILHQSSFPSEPRIFALLFHAKGDNVLSMKQIRHIFNVTDTIFTTPSYTDICKDGDVQYKLLNGTTITTCYASGIIRHWNFSSLYFDWTVRNETQVIDTVSSSNYRDGVPVDELFIYGNPIRDNETGLLTSLSSYSIVFGLPRTEKTKNVELDLVHTVLDINERWQQDPETAGYYVEAIAEGTFAEEFRRAIILDLPLIPVVVVIMTLFACFYFFRRKSKIQSRCLLGLGALASIILALLAGYGFLFMIGIPFTSMTSIIPFIITGVGLDDAFIIMDTYERTSRSKSDTEGRIHDTMQECGFSIALTTLTSAVAFGIGCTSIVPAVYWLCLYAFVMVILVLIWQLTFFIACIVIDEKRIQKRRRDCCLWIQMKNVEEYNNDVCEYNKAVTEHKDLTYQCVKWFAEHLLQPKTQVCVIIVFLAFAGICGWSASQFEQDFSFKDVLPHQSYMKNFVDSYETYEASLVTPIIYFRNEDFSKEYVQQQMEKYVNDIVGLKQVVKEPEFFWLRDFKTFLNASYADASHLDFNDQLKAFLNNTVYHELYHRDMAFAPDGTLIECRTKIYLNVKISGQIKEQLEWLNDQSLVSLNQTLNQGKDDLSFFTFHDMYKQWSFYSVCVGQLIQSTIIGILSVTAIGFILIPHWTAAIIICPIVCLMYVDILGILQWAGISISPVSYVALVMSIGLIVDYIMHVLLRFYETPGASNRERTIETLCTMGSSILAGGFSTFFATIPLAFSSSDIFFTISIAFLTLVSVAIAHGLIFLPVILTMFGPHVEKAILKSNVNKPLNTKNLSNFNNESVVVEILPNGRFSI